MDDTSNDTARRRLLRVFHAEGHEHLDVLSAGFRQWEHARPEQIRPLLEKLTREAHTFKGAARTVDQTAIETVCRALESILSLCKKRSLAANRTLLDLLYKALDVTARLTEGSSPDEEFDDVLARLAEQEACLAGQAPESQASATASLPEACAPTPAPSAGEFLSEIVKLPAQQLDLLLREAEEMVTEKSVLDNGLGRLRQWREQLRRALLTLSQAQEAGASHEREIVIRQLLGSFDTVQESLHQAAYTIGTTLRRHVHNAREAGMEPFAEAVEPLHRLVRDLCRQGHKEAELVVVGAGERIDRRILQELRTPLMHLLRNAIDHGIEPPELRTSQAKPPRGTVEIRLSRIDCDKIGISVSDDGAGIDADQLRSRVVTLGLLSEEEVGQLSERDVVDLIFRSGITTRGSVSDISGLGLGLAIVREGIERVAGQVWVESEKSRGTTFRIVLPTAITALAGVLIALGTWRGVVPTAYVSAAVRYAPESIVTVENVATLRHAGAFIALIDLAASLGLKRGRLEGQRMRTALIVNYAGRQLALEVDEVIEAREVMVRSLGPQLSRVPLISGATISETGRCLPIINVADLFAGEKTRLRYPGPSPELVRHMAEKKRILVVEDSITARTLLRGILESAGFEVEVAVDGAEAFTLLKPRRFDLVVSDIDMPRMNGLELTRRIREDKALADTPVVLVSALESREDRERGIDAGANAYIVKSRFDNANLIDTIRRLI